MQIECCLKITAVPIKPLLKIPVIYSYIYLCAAVMFPAFASSYLNDICSINCNKVEGIG